MSLVELALICTLVPEGTPFSCSPGAAFACGQCDNACHSRLTLSRIVCNAGAGVRRKSGSNNMKGDCNTRSRSARPCRAKDPLVCGCFLPHGSVSCFSEGPARGVRHAGPALSKLAPHAATRDGMQEEQPWRWAHVPSPIGRRRFYALVMSVQQSMGRVCCRQETASEANIDVCNVAALLMLQFVTMRRDNWTSSANVATAGAPPVPHGLRAAGGSS